jgi:hypothetical protein
LLDPVPDPVDPHDLGQAGWQGSGVFRECRVLS